MSALGSIDDFFNGFIASRQIFVAVQNAVDLIGPTELRVTKSQIAFVHQKTVLLAWIPGRYLRGGTAPLVLTFLFNALDPSPRWKEIVEPSPGHFTHHLELYSTNDVDAEVIDWMKKAYQLAVGLPSKNG